MAELDIIIPVYNEKASLLSQTKANAAKLKAIAEEG